MKIGIVSIWCNRGQGTVSRHIRDALDHLGHDTCVLARPAEGEKKIILSEDVWDQPGITYASEKKVPLEEYLAWVESEGVELIFCDQNYQFQEVKALRDRGVTTIGRFVWEQFRESNVPEAQEAYQVIYSLTECEQQRYARFGVVSPRVRWGCHPETIGVAQPNRSTEEITFFFPASGRRKLVKEALMAFNQFAPSNAKLIVKSNERAKNLELPDELVSDRVEWIKDDLGFQEFHTLMASCHVCLAPSKWEGLGLHLYEAIAHGLPIISIDSPPTNEIVIHQKTGLLVPGIEVTQSRSGIPGYTCNVEDLGQAIIQLSDINVWNTFHANVLEQRDRMAWQHTVDDLETLIQASQSN